MSGEIDPQRARRALETLARAVAAREHPLAQPDPVLDRMLGKVVEAVQAMESKAQERAGQDLLGQLLRRRAYGQLPYDWAEAEDRVLGRDLEELYADAYHRRISPEDFDAEVRRIIDGQPELFPDRPKAVALLGLKRERGASRGTPAQVLRDAVTSKHKDKALDVAAKVLAGCGKGTARRLLDGRGEAPETRRDRDFTLDRFYGVEPSRDEEQSVPDVYFRPPSIDDP